jgi:hypothetical protein
MTRRSEGLSWRELQLRRDQRSRRRRAGDPDAGPIVIHSRRGVRTQARAGQRAPKDGLLSFHRRGGANMLTHDSAPTRRRRSLSTRWHVRAEVPGRFS